MNPFLIEDELKMKSHNFSHFHSGLFELSFLILLILFPIFHLMFMKMCYAEYDNEADLKMQAQNRINL